MPAAIPVVAAVASVVGGATAVAAATTMAGAIIGGLMIAGGAMTLVGTVTGNEKLTQVGGIVSLAGGAAGLASGAFNGAASQIAEQTAADAAMQGAQEGFRAAEAGAASAQGGMLQGAPADAATAGKLNGLVDGATLSTPAQEAGQAQLVSNADAASPVAEATGQPSTTAARVNAAQNGTRAELVSSPSAAAVEPGVVEGTKLNSVVEGAVDFGKEAGSKISGTVSEFGQWMEKNKELAKVGGGIIKGMGDSYGQHELLKEKYKHDDDVEARRVKRFNDSVQGMRDVPLSVNSTMARAPATGSGILQRAYNRTT